MSLGKYWRRCLVLWGEQVIRQGKLANAQKGEKPWLVKPMDRMRDYFAGRLSADEMKKKLKTLAESNAQELASLVEFDERARNLLSSLDPPSGAADRLTQRIVFADTWMEQAEQARAGKPSSKWFGSLTPAFDVIGHGAPAHRKPNRKKRLKTSRKSRSKALKRSRKSQRGK